MSRGETQHDRTLAAGLDSSTELRPADSELLAGRYRILGVLGEGGMGTVYKVRDLELDEIVALKTLRRDALGSADAQARFRREVKLARRVTHRGVARTFDFGDHEGEPFLTMELIDGPSLAAVLDRSGQLEIAELIPRLGPLEWILASPRNHRVHHGRNGVYLDRNYGGFFIFWDRLLGTYVDESVAPEIGTRDGLRSWSPLWANFGHYAKLARQARAAAGLGAKLWVWLGPPEGHMSRAELVAAPTPEVPRYDARPSPVVSRYVLAQLLVLGGGTLYLLYARESLSLAWICAGSGMIVAGLISLSALLDLRVWAWRAELARLAVSLSAWLWLG